MLHEIVPDDGETRGIDGHAHDVGNAVPGDAVDVGGQVTLGEPDQRVTCPLRQSVAAPSAIWLPSSRYIDGYTREDA